MPDQYLTISEQPDAVIEAIAASMNARAAEPAMALICARYMGQLPKGGDVVEIGCGNGASMEHIAEHLAPRSLTGIDPSTGLLTLARERFGDRATFREGTATETDLADASADVVIAHTVFSHLPDPDRAIAEARRILRPGGTFAIFDGDYATNTVALFEDDPLQAAMRAVQRHLIHAPYVMRTLPARLAEAGFAVGTTEAHGYVQTDTPTYILTLIARGLDAAVRAGEIDPDMAAALTREAERRATEGTFYGAILFVSVNAAKPA